MTPTTTWTRLARRLGLDHNPLRRRSDLIDGWLLPGMIAAFLILGPFAGSAAGLWVHAGNVAAQRAQRSWHEVPAVLLQAAPGPEMSDNGANTWLVWTPARWTAGGRSHTGNVPASAGTSQGAVIPLWLDRTGSAQAPPMTTGEARDRVAAAASLALACLALLLAVVAVVARRVLDLGRLAGWEAAWLAVGPQWTRHA